MDTKRFAEIEAREQNATDGPWEVFEGIICLAGSEGKDEIGLGANRPEDRQFMAHARQDIPYLLDRVRFLEGEVARLRARLAPLEDREQHQDRYASAMIKANREEY